MPQVRNSDGGPRLRSTLGLRRFHRFGHAAAALGLCITSALIVAAGGPVPALLGGRSLEARAHPATSHRIAFQVSVNDPAIMQHVIGSADNAIKSYRARHEPVDVEIVANGAGLHMFRSDTSPVADGVRYLASLPEVTLSACGNSKTIMEAREGHSLTMLPGVRIVPAGIVRLVELEEAGWSYIRP